MLLYTYSKNLLKRIEKMKNLIEKLKNIFAGAVRLAGSKERLALFICIPITVFSVILSVLLIYGNNRKQDNDEVPTENEFSFPEDMFSESPKSDTPQKNSLEYQSLGDGTCLVMGIGTYRQSEVVIPTKSPSGDRVIGIGNGAFDGCKSIVSVSIPKTVSTIGSGVFRNCSSLVMISVDTDNESYSSSGGILYSKDKLHLVCCPAARIGENYLLNPNVRTIDDFAFDGIKNITRILYEKTTADFEMISIGKGNERFLELPITCNYLPSK